eukprot:2894791-Amphidinium_carterae.1
MCASSHGQREVTVTAQERHFRRPGNNAPFRRLYLTLRTQKSIFLAKVLEGAETRPPVRGLLLAFDSSAHCQPA